MAFGFAKLLFKRGNSANLPSSAAIGEPLYTQDTKKLYIGNGVGNQLTEIGPPIIYEAEIDFGSVALIEKKFTIVDSRVSPTSKLIVQHSLAAASGKAPDENEMDYLELRATPGTGEFTLFASANPGPVSGAFKINYIIGV